MVGTDAMNESERPAILAMLVEMGVRGAPSEQLDRLALASALNRISYGEPIFKLMVEASFNVNSHMPPATRCCTKDVSTR